jgi:peptide subunit release factor 1 (eRF1)
MEAKKKLCSKCGLMRSTNEDGLCPICHKESNELKESTKYQVKFMKDDKQETIIIEAVDVKEAATKAFKFGAQTIISADKYEKRKKSK